MKKRMAWAVLLLLVASLEVAGCAAKDPRVDVTPFVLKAAVKPDNAVSGNSTVEPCTRTYEESVAGGN